MEISIYCHSLSFDLSDHGTYLFPSKNLNWSPWGFRGKVITLKVPLPTSKKSINKVLFATDGYFKSVTLGCFNEE